MTKIKSAEEIICDKCDGSGAVIEVIGVTPACCGRADNNGNCCNNPIPEQVYGQQQCDKCEGLGTVNQL